MILSPDGYILTNHHVVGKAERIRVTLPDGRSFEGLVVGTDRLTDLAVLKVRADSPLPYATFGDSSRVQVGDWVVAVGNPYGFGHTVTVGVLSARERDLPAGSTALTGLLQTDAAINPGNSGGPLANLSGEVIGINTAIIPFARGIGFAVPSNTASEVAELLKEHGKVVRPYLGVELRDLTPEMMELLELPSSRGAAVTEVVPGSPAARAGIRQGDVIVRFGGQAVGSASELQDRVKTVAPGKRVQVALLREGGELELPVTVEEMPEGAENR